LSRKHYMSAALFDSQFPQSHIASAGSVSPLISDAYGQIIHVHRQLVVQSAHLRILTIPSFVLGTRRQLIGHFSAKASFFAKRMSVPSLSTSHLCPHSMHCTSPVTCGLTFLNCRVIRFAIMDDYMH